MGFIAYNENGDMQDYDSYSNVVKCKHCGREYNQLVEEQVPGFKDRSYDDCPYCHENNGSSMEVEYTNSRL